MQNSGTQWRKINHSHPIGIWHFGGTLALLSLHSVEMCVYSNSKANQYASRNERLKPSKAGASQRWEMPVQVFLGQLSVLIPRLLTLTNYHCTMQYLRWCIPEQMWPQAAFCNMGSIPKRSYGSFMAASVLFGMEFIMWTYSNIWHCLWLDSDHWFISFSIVTFTSWYINGISFTSF